MELNYCKIGLRYSFICQGTSTKRQRRDLFGCEMKLSLVTTMQSKHSNKGRGNPVKCRRPAFTLFLFYAERQAGKLWTCA